MFPKFKPASQCSALYLHIPFCHKICPFCSFTVRRDRSSLHGKYADALLQELKLSLGFRGSNLGPLKSLYFGGGTPSRLGLPMVRKILEGIREFYSFSPASEVTLECNPEDLTPEYLKGLLESGVNRISLGGQSFNDELLKRLGRTHTAKQLRSAIELLQKSRKANWNLDLMFGIPGQGFEGFCSDLEEALNARPDHLSLYGLEVHERTPFGHDPSVGKWHRDHPDLMGRMYLKGVQMAELEGLIQYEVSNFARKGKQSRSNLGVWDGEPYLGLGCGAHSFDGCRRWENRKSIRVYLESLKNFEAPRGFEEKLSSIQQASEMLMLSLRRPSGLDLEKWRIDFGLDEEDSESCLERLLLEGLVVWESPRLRLTPEGMLFADAITRELMPSGRRLDADDS